MEAMTKLMNQVCELTSAIKEKDAKIADLESRLSLARRIKYSRTSHKKSSKKNDDDNTPTPHTDAEADFDGTQESLPENMDVDAEKEKTSDANTRETAAEQKERELRLYRQGKTYKTMTADCHVDHPSDVSLLPEGAEFIKFIPRYAYDQVTTVTEHCFQMIRYKDRDGKIRCGYFPANGESPVIESVPGTHATPEFLAHLVFNRFFLDTPIYREHYRLMEEKMRVSRQTIHNWLYKGSEFFKYIIDLLKDKCLEKDSVVNCDETWCRVKMEGEYKKRYIWCLVNKKSKTVIYCYNDGSRKKDVLKHILGDSQIKALQSDGYAAYLYLDNEMLDVEHICCMAHIRAKFQYAAEIEHDESARFFLEKIGSLYKREDDYTRLKLTPDEIKVLRNSNETEEIKDAMEERLKYLKSDAAPQQGDLMKKAVRYFDHFWEQVWRYQNDGEYTIDNNLAERFIRPLANGRKNSLFFGSHKMARVSAAYHSIISTCKFQGISIMEYLKKFFKEIVAGNCDYEKLMSATIGIQAK